MRARVVLCWCNLVFLSTGFGKTISYWSLPLFIDFVFNGDPRDEDGQTLSAFIKPILVVISPLNNRYLMQEHCAGLGKLKTALKATFVSSDQIDDVYADVARGLYQLLFLSPERAAKELHKLFFSSLFRQRVAAVAVDEFEAPRWELAIVFRRRLQVKMTISNLEVNYFDLF